MGSTENTKYKAWGVYNRLQNLVVEDSWINLRWTRMFVIFRHCDTIAENQLQRREALFWPTAAEAAGEGEPRSGRGCGEIKLVPLRRPGSRWAESKLAGGFLASPDSVPSGLQAHWMVPPTYGEVLQLPFFMPTGFGEVLTDTPKCALLPKG